MRVAAPLLLAAALVPALAGCGSSGEDSSRPLPPVHLTVSAPADSLTTDGSTLTVRGSVDPPNATVRVLGRRAEVVAGSFTAQVDLDPGANVIDLAATAPHRGPTLTAVRVTRELPITVPDLAGLAPDTARAKVRALGLAYDEQKAGGLIEAILPGDPQVCEQDPHAGVQVTHGTSVTVTVAKRC
jgi:Glucodextranase, domain B/PASTA domain